MPTYSKETALYKEDAIANAVHAAGQTAEKYVNRIDDNGVTIHPYDETSGRVNDNHKANITSHGLEVVADNISRAHFGTDEDNNAYARIGDEDKMHAEIVPNSYSISKGIAGDKIFDAQTYQITIANYADVYKGQSATSSISFDLRFTAANNLSSVSEVYLEPNGFTHAGGIAIIANGAYLNGNSQTAYFKNDLEHFVVTQAWFTQYAPNWWQYRNNMYAFINTQLAQSQTVDTASVKIGNCEPASNYKLAIGSDDLTGSTVFSVDGNGKIATPQIQKGLTSSIQVPGQSYTEQVVAFSPQMSGTPTVVASIYSTSTEYNIGYVTVAVHSISANGFVIRLFNADSSLRIPRVSWIAIN